MDDKELLDIIFAGKKIELIEDVEAYFEKHIKPYIGDLTTERGRLITNLMLDKAGVVGFFRTFDGCLKDDSDVSKVLSGGMQFPSIELVTETFYPSVKNFLDYCTKEKVPFNLWMHPESESKTDIGYKTEEIAITRCYAKDETQTNFYVFTRRDREELASELNSQGLDPESIEQKIKQYHRFPKRIIKKHFGKKTDPLKAKEQARKNLKSIMEPGSMGPFPVNEFDQIYIDRESFENYREQKVNFATGHPNFSFNMKTKDAISALQAMYKDRVHLVYLFNEN